MAHGVAHFGKQLRRVSAVVSFKVLVQCGHAALRLNAVLGVSQATNDVDAVGAMAKALAPIHRSAVAADVGRSITALPFSNPARQCDQASSA